MADQRDDRRPSTADDVFDDEYAVDDFDMVADGFAPGRVQDGDSTRWSIHSEDPSIRDVNAHMADVSTYTPSGPSRNSISKSRDAQNPFTSTEDDDSDNDGQHSTLERSQSIMSSSTAQYAPGIAHRLSVASSARTFGRTASPLHGTSGPSHPYSMYPQGTNLARTPSISTTASTIRPATRSVVSTQGPTHPYSMYPQNVSEDAVDDGHVAGQTSHAQVHIPVGFPGGRNQDYVRRQGPEGEEQDIIGVDGHSEQLPPYSEYPEDGVPKTIVLPGQVVTPQSTGPTLPLMSQQQPGPQSMSDPSTVQGFAAIEQMDSAQSLTSSTNKSWSEKSWKEKRKTRFCGIPFWWILLSICVVAFIAIVLGASIGGFLSNAKKQAAKHPPHKGPTTTTLLDASPIPSASSGSPPPTGVYALSFGAPKATQSSCLTNQSFARAWDCNLYGTPQMAINIGYQDGSAQNGAEGACLWGHNNASGVNYGTQPPTTHFSEFISVQDDDEPYRGPAFYFQAYYDKFVIVPADGLPQGSSSSSSSSRKRDSNNAHINDEWQTRRQIVAGDKPWFCFWNQTFLEGFVYANNYTNSSSSSATPTSSSSMVTSTIVEVSGPSTTATLTSAYQPTSTAYHQRRDDGSGGQYSFADLSSFGYVVKVEERRIPDSPQAYCTQYQILNDGSAGILTDPTTGQPITVTLEETDPDYSAYNSNQVSRVRKRSDTVSGECHCEWWSGSG